MSSDLLSPLVVDVVVDWCGSILLDELVERLNQTLLAMLSDIVRGTVSDTTPSTKYLKEIIKDAAKFKRGFFTLRSVIMLHDTDSEVGPVMTYEATPHQPLAVDLFGQDDHKSPVDSYAQKSAILYGYLRANNRTNNVTDMLAGHVRGIISAAIPSELRKMVAGAIDKKPDVKSCVLVFVHQRPLVPVTGSDRGTSKRNRKLSSAASAGGAGNVSAIDMATPPGGDRAPDVGLCLSARQLSALGYYHKAVHMYIEKI